MPGSLFLTDVMLYLNVLLGGSLLCKEGVDAVAQAAEEASRLKRLMGSLRYLYRNSSLHKKTWCEKMKMPTNKNMHSPLGRDPRCVQPFAKGFGVESHAATFSSFSEGFFT